jgi:hypothetical protein
MNLFQIGLLFSSPVHTYLLTCETGYWLICIYVYMTGCVKCHMYFSTIVFANESWFCLCRVLSFCFSTTGTLRGNLAFGGRISTRTVIRRLHHHGMRAQRPIKRPQLTLRHRHARFDWSHDHLGWTIRTWRRVHWSDESRFLIRPTDGRARVWRQWNTSFQDNHILGTTAFGGGV